MRALFFAVLCVSLSNMAIAAERTLNCKDPQSNLEMKMCASTDLAVAESELKVAYERALKAAESQFDSVRREAGFETMPNMPEELRKTQRAWETFRDLNCGYQNLVYYGGSMASLAVTGCRRDMTKARVKELTDLVELE
jgi:uncharacterized protein YecT (DUF1311 family)